jgi:uncharacterized protein YwqG
MTVLELPEISSLPENLGELVRNAAQPCIIFEPDPGATGACSYGGKPLGLRGDVWPIGPLGPLSYIGHLDFCEMQVTAPQPHLPDSGRLLLFYDADRQPWGHEPEHSLSCAVRYIPDSDRELVSLPSPEHLPREFRHYPLQCRLAPSLPNEVDLRWPHLEDEARRRLWDYLQLFQLTEYQHPFRRHQSGGYPQWIQQDASVEAELVSRGFGTAQNLRFDVIPNLRELSREWVLLWQVSSDDEVGFMWGDLGCLYLLIRKDDLANREFGGCRVFLQCT